MFFRLTNSLATFQKMMNEILWDLINMRKVASFINNVILETEGEEGYDEIVEEIVRRLAENDLYIKLEKYRWKVQKIGILDVVIELKGNKIEKEKVKGILNWPTSKEVKDIQKFLRLANYYQWFIKDFTVIARPLYNLVKKSQKWNWPEKQEKAFQKLKKKFTKEPVLAVSDLDKK